MGDRFRELSTGILREAGSELGPSLRGQQGDHVAEDGNKNKGKEQDGPSGEKSGQAGSSRCLRKPWMVLKPSQAVSLSPLGPQIQWRQGDSDQMAVPRTQHQQGGSHKIMEKEQLTASWKNDEESTGLFFGHKFKEKRKLKWEMEIGEALRGRRPISKAPGRPGNI